MRPLHGAAKPSETDRLLRTALIFLSESDLARRFSTSAPGARSMARRFVAGETVDDGIEVARRLAEHGFFVSLDYLGESVSRRWEARAAGDTYMQLLDRIGNHSL